jgi:hypothetical protein
MSMLAADDLLPFPRDRDLDEVRSALEQALHCWQRDDLHEALRSLKRAARGAAERDQVDRALELSKAAADLASALEDESEETPRRSTVVPSARALAKGRVPAPPRLPSEMSSPPPLPNLPRMPGRARPRLASIPPVPADEQPLLLARRAEPAQTSLLDDDEEEPTIVRRPTEPPPEALSAHPTSIPMPAIDDEVTPISMIASRVAVFVNRERRALEVRPIGSDEAAPRGAAVAMLVAPSAHDAERLALLLRQIARW